MTPDVLRTAPPLVADSTRVGRLMRHWVYGGALAGLLILSLAPLLLAGWPAGEAAAFLALPVYMLHQYEEHDDDRFRRFVNAMMARGTEALTIPAVFVINILFVWCALALVLWAMRGINPGWGVVAGWYLVVNALAHLGPALGLRRSNPGLWTALVLFLPLGFAILAMLAPVTSAFQFWSGLGLVLLLHAAIALPVIRAHRSAR
jgi:hypothetical protein